MKQELPSDFDYKFAEMTIENSKAITEQTGEFFWKRDLEKITREIKNIGKGIAMGAIAAAAIYLPLMKGM